MQTPLRLRGSAGTYEVDGRMGRHVKFGGVLTARDELGRRVTIKALDRCPPGLAEALRRVGSVGRRDVAGVVDVFVGDDKRTCVVREMVEGTDLKTIFANKAVYGKIDEDEFLRMGCAVLRALAAVHAAGVVHRDIKPSNIVVRHAEGADVASADFADVALIDFEKSMTLPYDGTARTQFALIYSPPEMLLKHNEMVGPQADLFSLAITIFHLVMGRTPYNDCNPEVLINLQVIYGMKKPGRMTEALFAVLSRAAYKEPFRLAPRKLGPDEVEATLRRGVEARYPSAEEMLADLERVDHALTRANWLIRKLGVK